MASDKLCRYCNGKTKALWGTNEFVECMVCKLIMRESHSYTDKLETLYTDSWNDPLDQVSETGATDSGLAHQFLQSLECKPEISSVKEKHILDFGAGRGSMVAALKNAGARVVAVEPYGFEYLTAQGFSAYKSLSEIPKEILFDGIISIDVIEHLINPWENLSELMSRLNPGGWLYITTPNANSLNAILSGAEWREAKRRGHLWLFKPMTLENMLVHSGYNNVRRLRWEIIYNKNLLVRIKDFVLLKFNLDGELRFLATKSPSK